ncbi:MAG: polysaccharide biosynthesis tyrosine autokinase, partial [Hyphomicrobiaceae bacterium]|nr:polysaccharide biosynthesis tyrosine autokinase [Hyphomicrobiaceae bacterium]
DQGGIVIVKDGQTSSDGSIAARNFLETQYRVIRSRAMAERVVVKLGLAKNGEFAELRSQSMTRSIKKFIVSKEKGTESAKEQQQHAAAIVKKNVAVKPVGLSALVDISFTDRSPELAQRIADTYVASVIASNIDKRFQANSYAKTFLEDKIGQLKLRLEESRKAQIEFAQKEKIVEVNKSASIAQTNLAAANTALGVLISQRIKKEQSWQQVQAAKGINLSQFLANSVIDGLRGARNKLATEYREKRKIFKPGYPDMVQISDKIKEVDRQIATEVSAIKQSLKADYESALSQENKMQDRIKVLRAAVLDFQKRSIRYNMLKREVETNRSLYEGLLDRYKKVDIAAGVSSNNIFVVDKASYPYTPSSPKLKLTLLMSLALGLFAGFGVAFVIDHMDDTIKSPDDLQEITGLTTLGIIPVVAEGADFEEAFHDPLSAVSEAYRTLATSLQLSTENGLPKTLTITSAEAAEGKSSTSIAVARHFASMGLKVLLIDADLRKASLHQKLGLSNGIGLSTYLTGSCTPPEAMQPAQAIQTNLVFMASGPLPPNAADLLSSSRFHSLMTTSLEVFDFIMIDGPPVLGLADAQLLSNVTEATLFVVSAGNAPKSRVLGALQRLRMGRAKVIGTVMTKFGSKKSGYGYGYGYGYGGDQLSYGQSQPTDQDALEKQTPPPTGQT